MFGEDPSPDVLRGVVIDRACDVHPYCKRLGHEGHQACRFYSENLNWIVDPFHIKGHIVSYPFTNSFVSKIVSQEEKCTLSSELCEYHPDLEQHKDLTENINMEVWPLGFSET